MVEGNNQLNNNIMKKIEFDILCQIAESGSYSPSYLHRDLSDDGTVSIEIF